jgi:hypothetical protein
VHLFFLTLFFFSFLLSAPGINDDNSARDGIVKTYLKDADSVWIVSNIKRAVNDKSAKDMLGESFRRQLLMDGQYAQLAFVGECVRNVCAALLLCGGCMRMRVCVCVFACSHAHVHPIPPRAATATQSDVLVRSEIADNLSLPRSTPVAALAAARNAFTRTRIGDDFIDGLAEMSAASGETPDRAALRARFSLPVFTVSAIDFQKLSGARTADGPPEVWADAEATEVPALRRFIREATLRRRKATIGRHADALVAFADSIGSYLRDDGTSDAGQRDAARAAFDAQAAALVASLAAPQAQFASALAVHVKGAIGPHLQAGADDAAKACSDTARSWSGSWSRGGGGGGGGLHWATYKACCRRDGTRACG